ncbi:MAG: 3-hydroxyacyl-CoA dehydrogenase [Hyphomicrobiales bacterium]
MNDKSGVARTIGVVGAGAMGQGIAQVALTGGMNVIIHDARPGGAKEGLDTVFKRLDRLVEKERISGEDAEAMKGRAKAASGMADFAGCDVVVEAIFEDLDLKREIFAELEEVVSPDAIIASNTSSLLIASIARNCIHKNRIAGLHFFNPVPLMKLVEVVRGPETDDATIATLTDVGNAMGRTPVTVKDAPGFLVNLGGRAYTTEAMRVLHEQVATVEQVDAVMRDCCGFRMGPFELADLTGVDVNYPVSQIVYEGYNQDARLRTSFPHKSLFEAGRLGRKTAYGNYRYDEKGAMITASSPDLDTDAAPVSQVFVPEATGLLSEFLSDIGVKALNADDGKSPIVAAPLGEDCAAFAARTGIDHARLVAIDLYCNSSARVTIMTAPGADMSARDAAAAAISASGRKVTAIRDSAGFIAQRIQAHVANLGCEMAQIGIASPQEIDLAMRLGLNYPRGPLELAEFLGLENLFEFLNRIQSLTGDDRYRPSGWLRRRAALGLSIHTPD